MSTETKSRRNLLKASIVLSSIDGQVQAALYMPIIALIMQTFSKASPDLVMFSYSITSGVMVVVMFIAGRLARHIDKRTILMAGTAIFILGGFIGSLSPSVEFLIATRAIEGLGGGLAFPMVPAITAQLFEGRERTQVLGLCNAGACVLGFILNFSAGLIGALVGWRFCLYIYAIFIVVIVMQVKYIPKMGPEKRMLATTDMTGRKTRAPYQVYLLSLAVLVISCCGLVFTLTLSSYVVDAGIGDSTVAGTAGSIQTLAGFVIGVLFARIIKALGKYVPTVGLASLAVCYIGLSFSTTPLMVFASIVFVGIGFGLFFPYFNDCVANVTQNANVTVSMSYVAIGQLVGTFLCNFLVSNLLSITGGSYVALYRIIATGFLAAALVMAVVGLVRTLALRRHQQEQRQGS